MIFYALHIEIMEFVLIFFDVYFCTSLGMRAGNVREEQGGGDDDIVYARLYTMLFFVWKYRMLCTCGCFMKNLMASFEPTLLSAT